MQGVCEFVVVDRQQKPGLDATKVNAFWRECSKTSRRWNRFDRLDCSKPSGFREDEFDLDHLSMRFWTKDFIVV